MGWPWVQSWPRVRWMVSVVVRRSRGWGRLLVVRGLVVVRRMRLVRVGVGPISRMVWGVWVRVVMAVVNSMVLRMCWPQWWGLVAWSGVSQVPVVSDRIGMVGGCSGVSAMALVYSSTMGVMRVLWKAWEVVIGWVMRPWSSAVSMKALTAVVGPDTTQSWGLLWAARGSSGVSRGVMGV